MNQIWVLTRSCRRKYLHPYHPDIELVLFRMNQHQQQNQQGESGPGPGLQMAKAEQYPMAYSETIRNQLDTDLTHIIHFMYKDNKDKKPHTNLNQRGSCGHWASWSEKTYSIRLRRRRGVLHTCDRRRSRNYDLGKYEVLLIGMFKKFAIEQMVWTRYDSKVCFRNYVLNQVCYQRLALYYIFWTRYVKKVCLTFRKDVLNQICLENMFQTRYTMTMATSRAAEWSVCARDVPEVNTWSVEYCKSQVWTI